MKTAMTYTPTPPSAPLPAPEEASGFSPRPEGETMPSPDEYVSSGWPGRLVPVTPNPFLESFCRELGMDTIISHLYTWLGAQISLARILCFSIEKKTMTLLPITDISVYPPILRRLVDIRAMLPPESMDTPLDPDQAQVIFFRSDDMCSRLFLDAIDPHHASSACMLLHNDQEFVHYIGFFSDALQTFTLRHAGILAQLRPSLTASLHRRFYEFNLRSAKAIEPKTDPVELLCMCKGLKPLMRKVENIAPSEQHVVIMGETGTGKDILAEAIHRLSRRCDAPMVRINCGAISESLVDSELFGHERGAFTGAIATRPGYFEQADGGTIFLDEVGELPLGVQVRLLRVLDHGEIRRVGGMRPIQLNLRVIAATNRDLREEVRAGRFREDLWYRLCVYPLRVPPLRERPEDIHTLLTYFVASKTTPMGLTSIPHLDTRDLHALTQYSWPGNVRQLEHTVERAMLEHKLEPDSPWLRLEPEQTAGPLRADAPESAAPDDPLLTLDEATRRHIVRVLAHTRGKVSGARGAAALLGLPSSTLRAKMRRLGIAVRALSV